jgi:hypothetical protein
MLEEVWEDGDMFLTLQKKQLQITKELEEISAAKKNLTKKRSSASMHTCSRLSFRCVSEFGNCLFVRVTARASKKAGENEKESSNHATPAAVTPSASPSSSASASSAASSASSASSSSSSASTSTPAGAGVGAGAGWDGAFARPAPPVFDELTEQSEVFNLRQLLLKKQLSDLKEQESALEAKKEKFIRFQKLMRDEAKSRFALTAYVLRCVPFLSVLAYLSLYRAYIRSMFELRSN